MLFLSKDRVFIWPKLRPPLDPGDRQVRPKLFLRRSQCCFGIGTVKEGNAGGGENRVRDEPRKRFALRRFSGRDIPTLGITCAAASELARTCSHTLELTAADESTVMTRSFTSMLLALRNWPQRALEPMQSPLRRFNRAGWRRGFSVLTNRSKLSQQVEISRTMFFWRKDRFTRSHAKQD